MKALCSFTYALAAVLILGIFSNMGIYAALSTFEECAKEITIYFPEALVTETLKKFNVPETKWSDIKRDLNERDSLIVKMVEEKASKMNPNPLKDLQIKDAQQLQAAVKIYKETLYTNFAEVLHKYGITDEKQIQNMLDDIQQQKAKKLASCLEKQRPEAEPKRLQKQQEQAEESLADALPQKTFNAQIRPGLDTEFANPVPQDPHPAFFKTVATPHREIIEIKTPPPVKISYPPLRPRHR